MNIFDVLKTNVGNNKCESMVDEQELVIYSAVNRGR